MDACMHGTLHDVDTRNTLNADNFFDVGGGGGGADCLELLLTPLGGPGGIPPKKFWLFRALDLRLLLVQSHWWKAS